MTVRRASTSLLLALSLTVAFSVAGCGGGAASIGRDDALVRLSEAIPAPINTVEQGQEHSRLVQRIVEQGWLENLFRHEVADRIGQGSPCSAHPTCAEQGFSGDDWYYAVGTTGERGPMLVPSLVLGFDGSGRVTRVYYQRTH